MELPPTLSYRFGVLIEETIEKLDLLSLIVLDKQNEANNVYQNKSDKVASDHIQLLVQQQRELESRYRTLVEQRSHLKSLSNRAKYINNQQELKQVAAALRDSTRALCHVLKDTSQGLAGNYGKVAADREELKQLLQLTQHELVYDFNFHKLVQHVGLHFEQQKQLQKAEEKAQQTNQTMQKLEKELAELHELRDKDVKEKNQIIGKLTEQLHQLREETAVNCRYELKSAEARSGTLRRVRQQRLDKLDQQIRQLEHRRATEANVNAFTASYLERTQQTAERQNQEWLARIDREIKEKERELKNAIQTREKNLKELAALRERWEQDQAARAAQEAYEKAQKEAEERERIRRERQHRAATLLARWWRYWHVKRAESLAKKKPKKKSSKKAGAKGAKASSSGTKPKAAAKPGSAKKAR
eukprot:TRINITY_DN8577_c0_g1_i1.p1 TRINITY_DN8577_c0_g1~~TRINITY_DN8577_c0_g1_i1.p1  ORF type:complete len:416 (+),score=63.22 TRINITY_DN8577_c0_g1_i1:66-1313(+)